MYVSFHHLHMWSLGGTEECMERQVILSHPVSEIRTTLGYIREAELQTLHLPNMSLQCRGWRCSITAFVS